MSDDAEIPHSNITQFKWERKMKHRRFRKSAFKALTALLLLFLTAGSLYAEFKPKSEYKSVITTDPATKELFSTIFLGMNKPQVNEVTEGVYVARGYGQGNAIMLEGDDGIVIYDMGDSYENGKAMLAEFRKITDKPIKALIYSHYHFDHIFGAKAWADDAGEDVQIIAHESTVKYLNERVSALAPRTDWGLAMQFGMYLDETVSVGEGPLGSGLMGIQFPNIGSAKGHQRHIIYPTRTFNEEVLELDIAGMEIQLIHTPSETEDNIILWMPDKRVVLTGDAWAPTLPPLFTARGQRVRDPEGYLNALDLMRSLNPEHVVPSHGFPLSGPEGIGVLTNFRDAIAYIYHQTVRGINQGMGAEEIAAELELPPHLANNMLLGEWYNDLQTQVRGVYSFLVGHYSDVAEMPLLEPDEEDSNMIALAGGPKRYFRKLKKAYDRGDYVFVARASSHLINLQPDNQEIKDLKAAALRALAGQVVAGSHRHFYLQHAAALEGHIDIPVRSNLTPGSVAGVPVSSLIRNLPFRLNAEKAVDLRNSMTIGISDTGETYTIDMRNGVAEVKAADKDADLTMDSRGFRLFYIGQLSLDEGFASGNFSGDKALAVEILSNFDRPQS